MDAKNSNGKSSDAVAFDRLHALVKRGYRPIYGTGHSDGLYSSIELRHPKTKGEGAPPSVTLWSNGIVSTTMILWPRQYVPSSGEVPVWQKFIDSTDDACFDRFAGEVPLPNFYDRYFSSAFQKARSIAIVAVFAVSLCGILPLTSKLLPTVLAGGA
jgi:hypothetical protein